jgi:hypothetical protein
MYLNPSRETIKKKNQWRLDLTYNLGEEVLVGIVVQRRDCTAGTQPRMQGDLFHIASALYLCGNIHE